MKLNDREIRSSLLRYLSSLTHRPSKIFEELHIHRGNAIADVVALHKEPHCYEIKGDNDNISRLKKQGYYYDLAFRKITLVTTRKKLNKALAECPHYWGVIIAEIDKETVKLKHYRKANVSPFYSKEVALQTLWKEEMFQMAEECNLDIDKKLNKVSLAKDIALKTTIQGVQETISKALIHRISKDESLS
ncbi:sce7726 family protein [Vibrio europaeus]|uniref:sce7726 family protein n=1 Tax=Vibrio europaeus TaxID=300876 RepID=UPI0018A6FD35|nr:sce7726 family protein [Vibrio europaeus]MDC5809276.1 sce7726 family protein [Vibrio europaeus]QPG36809.1 sce7726 family protein [Vibrio europaeus]